MKKSILMFLVIVLCVTVLVSCKDGLAEQQSSLSESSKEESTVSDAESSVGEESIFEIFEGELTVDTTVGENCVSSLPRSFFESDLGRSFLVKGNNNLYIIKTQEEFDSLAQYIPKDLENSEESSSNLLPEGFFDESVLMIARFCSPSGGYGYDFLGATAENGIVEISFSGTEPRTGEVVVDAEMIQIFSLALKKSEIEGYEQFECSVIKLFAINVEAAHNENKYHDNLSVEDSLRFYEILETLEWTDGQPDCLFDQDFESSYDCRYKYHSECGTVYDIENNRNAVLSDEDKAVFEEFFGKAE